MQGEETSGRGASAPLHRNTVKYLVEGVGAVSRDDRTIMVARSAFRKAVPVNLHMGNARFERAAYGSGGHRSIQLS